MRLLSSSDILSVPSWITLSISRSQIFCHIFPTCQPSKSEQWNSAALHEQSRVRQRHQQDESQFTNIAHRRKGCLHWQIQGERFWGESAKHANVPLEVVVPCVSSHCCCQGHWNGYAWTSLPADFKRSIIGWNVCQSSALVWFLNQ